jgi:hypothetical protein
MPSLIEWRALPAGDFHEGRCDEGRFGDHEVVAGVNVPQSPRSSGGAAGDDFEQRLGLVGLPGFEPGTS